MDNIYFIISILFLLGTACLSLFSSALLFYLESYQTHTKMLLTKPSLPIVSYLKFLSKKKGIENLYFSINFTKHLTILLYACFFLVFLKTLSIHILGAIALVVLVSFLTNYFMQVLGHIFVEKILYISSLLSFFYILGFFPITFFFIHYNFLKKPALLDIIQSSDLNKIIDPKILRSLFTFKEKVAREVMIPRVKIFSLPANTIIKEANRIILEEDYSRIPIYRDKIDNIIGILMYKDILKTYLQGDEKEKSLMLNATIETLIKPVIYTPENKKISHLFQEFRSQHKHLAIVVNEYGGTEGIITIEDILEELVGEIQDEYDIDEERQFWQLPNDNWVVDAKMSIIDIEKKLNIRIPHSTEYETIGGFVFHRAGTIPKKGWTIHLDEFDLEVLLSNERCIEKIRINTKTQEY